MSVIYTPSFRGSVDNLYKGRTCAWWRPDSYIFHPALLANAATEINVWNFREKNKIPRDILLVGDSGGFQLLTGQCTFLEPINVLRWMENNVDIGMTLDVPPVNPVSLSPLNDVSYFTKCAKKSARFYEKMEQNRVSNSLKLLKVIQGGNKKELDIWYNTTNSSEFDGCSLSAKPPSDPMQIALLSCYIHEKEQPQNIHILAGTGFNVMPVIVYVSQLFQNITFDSSAHTFGVRTRKYLLPLAPKISIYFTTANPTKLKSFPCTCPVCTISSLDDVYNDIPNLGLALTIHNIWIIKQYVETIKKLLDDRDIFYLFVRDSCNSRTLRSLEMIDYYLEVGDFSSTYNKYIDYFQENATTQGTL